jgi:hypothetical protein
LVVFFLKGASKSLSVELEDYFQILGKQETTCSKQAVSKARMKLKHEAFIVLNDAAVEEYILLLPLVREVRSRGKGLVQRHGV